MQANARIIGVVEGGLITLPPDVAAVTHATPADLDAVIAMAKEMHAESPRYRGMRFDENRVRHLFTAVLAKAAAGEACMLLAKDGDSAVGMMVCMVATRFFGDEKYTTDLAVFVKPARRGGSALGRLVGTFEQWAIAQGLTDLNLGVSTEVPAAVRAYEKLGYRLSGHLMVKQLEANRV